MEFWQNTEFVDWYKQSILRERILEETSAWLLQLTATDKFLHLVGLSLTLSMGAAHAAVLISDPERGDYRIRMSYGMKKIPSSLVKLDSDSVLVRGFNRGKSKPLEISGEAQGDLKRFRADKCFPIYAHGRFFGLLLIGPRLDGKAYEHETIGFFRTLTNDIGAEMEKEDYYNDSMKDPLTGLYNRKYMDDATHILMKQTKESGARIAFALIDVDHFKLINDTFGHGAGDLVLKIIAEKIRKNVRVTDPCIRYGGEEFCIIFSDFVRRDGTLLNSGSDEFSDAVQSVVRRLKDEIGKAAINWEGKPIRVTVSIGLTFLRAGEKAWDAGELLKEADHMLYEAKRAGRNRIFIHSHDR